MSKKQQNFPWAIKSFIGFLEGTGKSANTIASYRLDLNSAFQFLVGSRKWSSESSLSSVTPKDIQGFSDFLKTSGQKTNTRRRKLISLKQFLEYHYRRKNLRTDLSSLVITPAKIERVPLTLDWDEVLEKVKSLPSDSVLTSRNRILFWLLLETGCLVSEVTHLKVSQFSKKGKAAWLEFDGKSARGVPISEELFEEIEKCRLQIKANGEVAEGYLFKGFNRFGPVTFKMTPRGVEILVKTFAQKFELVGLTPRVIRHTRIKSWIVSGVTNQEIMNRLGLKTPYLFRAYQTFYPKMALS